jgi:hypothetical protein
MIRIIPKEESCYYGRTNSKNPYRFDSSMQPGNSFPCRVNSDHLICYAQEAINGIHTWLWFVLLLVIKYLLGYLSVNAWQPWVCYPCLLLLSYVHTSIVLYGFNQVTKNHIFLCHTRQNITINSSVQNYIWSWNLRVSKICFSCCVYFLYIEAILVESNFVLMAVGN